MLTSDFGKFKFCRNKDIKMYLLSIEGNLCFDLRQVSLDLISLGTLNAFLSNRVSLPDVLKKNFRFFSLV